VSAVSCFEEGQVESIAKVLGECGSGTDITRVMTDRGLVDDSGESTKWRRLYHVFLMQQRRTGSANVVLDFARALLAPARFAGRGEEFERGRQELNVVLAFSGLEYGADGQFHRRSKAATLDEAERRARTIRGKFQGRAVHLEVLKYCRSELMQQNYFHAVFEACKGLAQRIRDLSGAQADGAALVDRVFAMECPVLAFNTLQTVSEQSEHKGFAALLKGCFAAVRNPLAHEPKVLWEGEEDTADWLSLISLLHRKLDGCVKTGLGGSA
jgi:uncharacterized protein (TIGR02391 family)